MPKTNRNVHSSEIGPRETNGSTSIYPLTEHATKKAQRYEGLNRKLLDVHFPMVTGSDYFGFTFSISESEANINVQD